MQKLVCITGPRGAGKETVVNFILSSIKKGSIHRVVPFTTRKKRDGEFNGVDHLFISEEEFLRKKDKKDILYQVQIGKNNEEHYFSGTFKSEFDRYENGVIEIAVEGARVLSSYSQSTLLVFVYASEEERCRRIMKRQKISEEKALELMQDEPSPGSLENIGILYPEFHVIYNHDGDNISVKKMIQVVIDFIAT
jgi:guanylate kinase